LEFCATWNLTWRSLFGQCGFDKVTVVVVLGCLIEVFVQ
jgi:hypothetical protein